MTSIELNVLGRSKRQGRGTKKVSVTVVVVFGGVIPELTHILLPARSHPSLVEGPKSPTLSGIPAHALSVEAGAANIMRRSSASSSN